ncbi:MAG: hypothetical protein IJP80_00785 [Bacteroidales bacterium]|nr:hypothetical protein [Bacteroidales bacterium]
MRSSKALLDIISFGHDHVAFISVVCGEKRFVIKTFDYFVAISDLSRRHRSITSLEDKHRSSKR